MSIRPHLIGLAVLALAGCKDGGGEDSGDVNDIPSMTHTPSGEVTLEGEPIPISVSASDEDGVGEVILSYRELDTDYWSQLELVSDDGGETWTGEVPGEDAVSPGIEYYFKATDLSDDALVGLLPEDVGEETFEAEVSVTGFGLPFFEDFELEGSESDIFSLGWANDSLGFSGYRWDLSSSRANSGEVSVGHLRGTEDTADMDDWLITPALDFSGADRLQVRWYEYGASAEDATHTLLVSTGSRIPSDGDYVEIATLDPAPEREWGRSAVIELSDYAGERAVYLAWRYVGQYADDWYIDDVSVEDLTIDLDTALTASSAGPGETMTLDLDIANLVDVEGGPLTVTATLPDGGGVFTSDTATTGTLDPNGSTSVSFELAVDAAWPDNSYLPLSFSLTDGADTWVHDDQVIIGVPSALRLELETFAEGLVSVDIGVGDPDDPALLIEEAYAAETTVGPLSIALDITDHYALLAPAAGELRWWARLSSEGSGNVDLFEIDFDESTYSALTLPSFAEEEEVLVYVPDPPDPVLVSQVTDPVTPAPGDRVFLDVELTNEGADTSDGVAISLLTSDPDVTLVVAGPKTLSSNIWEAGTTKGPVRFKFDVSEDHLDSTPVYVELELDDGTESWVIPVEVEVPWAVIKVTNVEIDDDDFGDGDGLLEAGESAEIDFELTNVGDLDAVGTVRATAAVDAGSAATASTPSGEEDILGSLGVNTTRTATFDVTVDAAAAVGDLIDMTITSTDSNTSYQSVVQLIVGEPPWLSVGALDDDYGDANSSDFDLLNAKYRSDGSTVEVILESWTEYGSTSFVEMWAVASGTADYTYYRLVYQSGVAKLQGYDSSGFNTILNPTVEYLSATEIKLSWDREPMGLGTSGSMRVGFGAGWCGAETGSFCDHFPDNWGYYYDGTTYNTSNFYSVSF